MKMTSRKVLTRSLQQVKLAARLAGVQHRCILHEFCCDFPIMPQVKHKSQHMWAILGFLYALGCPLLPESSMVPWMLDSLRFLVYAGKTAHHALRH